MSYYNKLVKTYYELEQQKQNESNEKTRNAIEQHLSKLEDEIFDIETDVKNHENW